MKPSHSYAPILYTLSRSSYQVHGRVNAWHESAYALHIFITYAECGKPLRFYGSFYSMCNQPWYCTNICNSCANCLLRISGKMTEKVRREVKFLQPVTHPSDHPEQGYCKYKLNNRELPFNSTTKQHKWTRMNNIIFLYIFTFWWRESLLVLLYPFNRRKLLAASSARTGSLRRNDAESDGTSGAWAERSPFIISQTVTFTIDLLISPAAAAAEWSRRRNHHEITRGGGGSWERRKLLFF